MRNFRHKPTKTEGKIFTQLSQTQPNQSLSMREILNRYAKGLPLGGKDLNTAIWDEDSEGINPKTLDLAELEQIERINTEKIETSIKKRNKAQNDKRVADEIQKIKQQLENQKPDEQ